MLCLLLLRAPVAEFAFPLPAKQFTLILIPSRETNSADCLTPACTSSDDGRRIPAAALADQYPIRIALRGSIKSRAFGDGQLKTYAGTARSRGFGCPRGFTKVANKRVIPVFHRDTLKNILR
jgi:hypothetical protein